jgi:hypothetical protein
MTTTEPPEGTSMITITIPRTRAVIATAIVLASALLMLAGCGLNKAFEPFNDAPISHKNDLPAVVGSMPDGFSNWAGKCDGQGHWVVVVYHGDSTYGAPAVVADPKCR